MRPINRRNLVRQRELGNALCLTANMSAGHMIWLPTVMANSEALL